MINQWVLDYHTYRHHTSFSWTKLPSLASCRFSLAQILKQSKSYKGPCYCHQYLIIWSPTGSEKRAFDAWKCAEIKQTHWPIKIPTNTGYYYMITIDLVNPQQVRCFFITFLVCRDFEIFQLGDLLDLGDSGRSFAQQGR